ncbi:methyl-accepting chemotaxis protein [Ferrovibrio sp.]|uniref:methyl-accepting chemotaxis protein n=1 Tax=Ferrovibrio sp. TaxID=1917215 RepID=UPI0035B096D4
MAWFRNLSLSVKLFAVVAILIATAAIQVLVAINGANKMEAALDRIELKGDQIEHAGRGGINFVQFVRMTENMTRPLSPELRERVVAGAADELRRFLSRMERLKPLLDDDFEKSEFALAMAAAEKYQDSYKRILADTEQLRFELAERTVIAASQHYNAARQHIRNLEERFTSELNEEEQMERASVIQMRQALILIAIVGGGTGLLLALGIIIYGVTRPLGGMIGAMQRLAQGDLEADVPVLRQTDEIGRMGSALAVFKTNAVERRNAEAAVEAQRREADRLRQEREHRESKAAEEVADLCRRIVAGDLSGRLDEADKEGFLLALSRELNRLSGTLGSVTGDLAQVMQAMAEGDLSREVAGEYEGVFATLKGSANGMAGKLREFAGRLLNTTQTVRGASNEISTGSQDLAQRTESQAASIEETAASMHEITTTVRQNADNAQAANQLATAARDTAEKGGSITEQAVVAVSEIEESARKIADIMALIDEIAFQTNLLALNASVEAARAGEAGKGFAVVAQEVRALAQRSANASKEIKALIQASNAQVKTGAGLVNQAGRSLVDIVGAVKKVADIVAEIAAASREQATGLDQVNTAVASMDEMTQRNAALVEETTAAAQSLANQANELAELARFFKTGNEIRVNTPAVGAVLQKPAVSKPAAAAVPAAKPAIARPALAKPAAPKPVATKPVPTPLAPARALPPVADDDDWKEF